MNAQTAAVIDFQKPLQVKSELIKINFSHWVSTQMKEDLMRAFTSKWKQWRVHSMAAIDRNNSRREADLKEAYHWTYWALGFLSSLQTTGAISLNEWERLNALFDKQPDLFAEFQAA